MASVISYSIEQANQLYPDAYNWIQTSDIRFAMSLRQHLKSRNGYLTDNQWFRAQEIAKYNSFPKPKAKKAISCLNIQKLMRNSLIDSRVQSPEIHYRLNKMDSISFKLINYGKHNGRIFLNGPKGYFDKLGVIEEDGSLFTYPKMTEEYLAIIEKVEENPQKALQESGKLSGKCCYCKNKLTDERSLQVGYGAQCARNYRLDYPSGKKVKNAKPIVQSIPVPAREPKESITYVGKIESLTPAKPTKNKVRVQMRVSSNNLIKEGNL